MRTLLAAAAAVAVTAGVVAGCGADGPDDRDAQMASALCTALQDWIDGIERTSKELSDQATADPAGSDRKRLFEAWGDAVLVQTEQLRDDVEALDLPGPLPGLGDGIEILRAARAEIAAMPDRDPETLGYRVARAFLSMENVFAKTRTSVERLGDVSGDDGLATALVEEDACRDYNDPLT